MSKPDNSIDAKVLKYSEDPVDFKDFSYRMCCMGPTLIQDNGVYNRKIIIEYAADQMSELHEVEREEGEVEREQGDE